MKVAIVYDRVNKWGGAERVLLALHKIFPQAELYTSVHNTQTTSWSKVFVIKTSYLQHIPGAKVSHELFAPFMPSAFESFSFDDYDIVLSVTSEAAKGVITKPQTLHICICLTPTRYLWSGYTEYFRNKILTTMVTPITAYLRVWDTIASSRPDYYIAISQTVADRITKYYHRDSTVIYPPLMLDTYKVKNTKQVEKKSDYFLVVARLSRFTTYKKVEMVIEAAKRLSLPLRVVGEGSKLSEFKREESKYIKFLGRLTDGELSYYYKNCRALIYPANEDFGLAMVEAQSFGKPVIAFRGGGALEIIQESKTGEFFDYQTVESLMSTLEKFDETRYNRSDCKKNAQRFTFLSFKSQILAFIQSKLQERRSI